MDEIFNKINYFSVNNVDNLPKEEIKNKINELIKISKFVEEQNNYILVLDLETNGLPETIGFNRYYSYMDIDKYKSSRIVQCCMAIYDKNGNEIEIMDKLIKPSGYDISNANIHGITYEKAVKEGIEFQSIISTIKEYLMRSCLIVGHNINFDVNILSSELYRIGESSIAYNLVTKNRYCTMFKSKHIVKVLNSTGRVKLPKLSELYFSLFGTESKGNHDAKYDVRNCAKCYFKLIGK
jgi:DNA polymerase-3 subunit alpha